MPEGGLNHMKIRGDFIIALFILFAVPAIGYFTLRKAVDTRKKISASLQPKDSLDVSFRIRFPDEEGNMTSARLVDLPYTIKVMSHEKDLLGEQEMKEILYIINDREDFAFMVFHEPPAKRDHDRIYEFDLPDGEDLPSYGDVLLIDAFNRILQVFDASDPELYKNILEDISYAFPMVDYQIEHRNP